MFILTFVYKYRPASSTQCVFRHFEFAQRECFFFQFSIGFGFQKQKISKIQILPTLPDYQVSFFLMLTTSKILINILADSF